jgi:hypothetical protein
VMDRQALDARNTNAGVTDFHDLIADRFNDTEWVPSTCVNASLHSFLLNLLFVQNVSNML